MPEVGTERHAARDLSWFMRALNEPLARRANAEDGCTGRFWEGRFKSQALLMAYVDLNPIRAGIAATPEASDFTSIQQRIRERGRTSADDTEASVPLLPFQDQGPEKENQTTIPFRFDDYLQLVDWTGRSIRNGKASIDSSLPPILTRLKIDPDAWEHAMMPGKKHLFGRALGQLDHLRLHAEQLKQTWIRGRGLCAKLYS